MPEVLTFRAATLAEALALVRERLGPNASVLKTRRVGSTLTRLVGGQAIEVIASTDVEVPSRLPKTADFLPGFRRSLPGAEMQNYRQTMRRNLERAGRLEASLVERLAHAGTTKVNA